MAAAATPLEDPRAAAAVGDASMGAESARLRNSAFCRSSPSSSRARLPYCGGYVSAYV